MVLLLHLIDHRTLVLQCVGLFDAGHEVRLNHRVGGTVQQVLQGEVLQSQQILPLKQGLVTLGSPTSDYVLLSQTKFNDGK